MRLYWLQAVPHILASYLVLMLILVSFQPVRANENEGAMLPENPTLADYILIAEKNNPDLKAAFYRWKGQVEKSGYAGTLPDPEISYGYFIEQVETRVGPQEQRFGVRQMIPWIGKLKAEKSAANEAAEASLKRFEQKRLELLYRVKSAYYDLYFTEYEIRLTEEQMALLLYWESIVRTKYTVGMKEYPDLLKAQVEAGKLEEKLLTLREKRRPLESQLQTLLDIDSPIRIDPNDSVRIESIVYTDDELEAFLAENPSLEATGHLIKQQEAMVSVMAGDKYPRLTVGVDYIQTGEAMSPTIAESGKDPLILAVGINLPIWWGKNRAKTGEAKALKNAYEYEHRDQRNRLRTALTETLFAYHSSVRRVELYRDGLIPKAEEAVQAGFAAYEADKIDFLALLESQKDLLEFHLIYTRALVDAEKSRARLEMLTGTELTEK